MPHSGSDKPDPDSPTNPEKHTTSHSSTDKPDSKFTLLHSGSDKPDKNSPGKPPRPPMSQSGSDKPDSNSPGKPPRPSTPHSGSQKPGSSHSGSDKSDPNSPQRTEKPKSTYSGADKSDSNSPLKTEKPKSSHSNPPRKREKPKTSHGGRYKYYNFGSPVSHFQTAPSSCSSSSGSVSVVTRPDSISSSSSTAAPLILPYGNIVPSGRVKSVILDYKSKRPTVLGSGTRNYGYGSVVRSSAKETGGSGGDSAFQKEALVIMDPEELKKMGNERYNKGDYYEALGFYDRAIGISPTNVVYMFNKGMACVGLKKFEEAVGEFEEVIRLDKDYVKARHNLGSIFIRLGQVENARTHLFFPSYKPDPKEVRKCQAVETHLNKCSEARLIKDWKSVLKEADDAIAAGADSSPQLDACRAEALLKLYSLEEANKSLSKVLESEQTSPLSSQWKFFGILSVAYLFFVRAQIEMAYGRFEKATSLAEKAGTIDPKNVEVALLINNVKQATRARTRGNFFYKSERYEEARLAYNEGLEIDPSNTILLYNRAACQFKLELWESSVDDCTQALLMQPNYTKALFRRAASNFKLERWARAVSDYETLRKELPHDIKVAENLFHAQISLRKSRGEDVSNMKFGQVKLVSDLDLFKATTSTSGVSVVFFKSAIDPKCKQISTFLDKLCARYPMITFLKVDVEQSRKIATSENVRMVPTFKIYRKGERIKEMIGPSLEALEASVSYYSL